MITIDRKEADNMSGVIEISFLDVNDIVFIPAQVKHLITENGILIRSGSSWLTLYGTPESILFSCPPEDTSAGVIYNYSLTLRNPGEDPNVIAAFEDMARRPMILTIEDSNSVRKILGEIRNPMRMKYNQVKPAESAGYNGSEITFSGIYTHTPYLLI
jgi:hypothetical protein